VTGSRPRYVDEHSVSLPVPPEEAYAAAGSLAERLVAPPTGRALVLLTRLLGTDPPSGFAIAEDQPPRLLSLAGRHRFSRYVMELRVDPAPGGSTVTVVTWADFPGPRGAVYRWSSAAAATSSPYAGCWPPSRPALDPDPGSCSLSRVVEWSRTTRIRPGNLPLGTNRHPDGPHAGRPPAGSVTRRGG
jgi:hypothetical protein